MTIEITPKTSTNITRYLYSWTGWKGFLAPRKQQCWLKLQKICLSKQIWFQHFVLAQILKIITSIMCDLDNRNKSFFPVVKSEINCPSDGLVKTTKSSFPFLLLLTNQLAGFTAPILSRFAYFCHPTTIICNLSTLNSL